MASELELGVDEADVDGVEQAGEIVVDAQCIAEHLVELVFGGPAKGQNVLVQHQRVVELVVLEVPLDQRPRQGGAFLDVQALAQAAGRDVPNHHFDGDDLDFAHQLFAHVQRPEKMVRDVHLAEPHHQVGRDAVVDDALAADGAALLVVERRGVVLEMLDERAGFRAFEQCLGLALVDQTTALSGHGSGLQDGRACCAQPMLRVMVSIAPRCRRGKHAR